MLEGDSFKFNASPSKNVKKALKKSHGIVFTSATKLAYNIN